MTSNRPGRPVFARTYVWLSERLEPGVADHRRALVAGLTGRVIEVGAGNGLNFAYYPPEVAHVLAVEPEPHLRQIAQRNAARAGVRVDVVDGVAERLPAANGSFDAAVASLVLCSVPEPTAALAEILRVLRPGGQLRFYEHVRSDAPSAARVQRLLDATVWPRLAGGCHVSRNAVASIKAAGFDIKAVETVSLPVPRRVAALYPHVLGTATRR